MTLGEGVATADVAAAGGLVDETDALELCGLK